MDLILTGLSQSGIVAAARDAGLSLTAEQAREIAEVESACLAERRRVSFGESATARLIREFAASPFLSSGDEAATLMDLTEAFYELREDFPASTTDVEIIDALRDSFNGEAAGDVGLAAASANVQLSENDSSPVYEIADDDGNVYRWDPDEWHDDLYSDGWYGERWEDADE